MGLIREPLDVDFEVISKPLTQEENRMLLEFLHNQRLELARAKQTTPTKRMPTPLRRKKVLA